MTREDILEHLDYIRSAGRLEYNDYSELHDMVSELEQQPQDCDKVSIEVLKQVMWERDIAIEQLKELGYSLGEKIEPQQQWISVSEKYPPVEEQYNEFLTVDGSGRMSVQRFYLTISNDPQPYFSGALNVIAWMPLPKPYEPQESEDKV